MKCTPCELLDLEQQHYEEKCHLGCNPDECILANTCSCECESCSHKTCKEVVANGN